MNIPGYDQTQIMAYKKIEENDDKTQTAGKKLGGGGGFKFWSTLSIKRAFLSVKK